MPKALRLGHLLGLGVAGISTCLANTASALPLEPLWVESGSFLSAAGLTPQLPGSDTSTLSGYVYTLDAPPIVQISGNGADDIVFDAPLLVAHSFRIDANTPSWDLTADTTIEFNPNAYIQGVSPIGGGAGTLGDFGAFAIVRSELTGVPRACCPPVHCDGRRLPRPGSRLRIPPLRHRRLGPERQRERIALP